jgi:hypothetical protein
VEQIFVWEGWEGEQWHAESATVSFGDSRMLATGTQLGADPVPYTLSYSLAVDLPGFVTRRLSVAARGADWSRAVELEHAVDGEWTVSSEALGTVDLPPPGGDAFTLSDARDIDLALSPLTNWMPARRFDSGSNDFVMAFVEVPSLRVVADRQRYTWVSADVVRYESIDDTFSAEIKVDDDGFVVEYPGIARRVAAG